MDNGEVIPGLNEDWMFAGAKLMEWMCGFMAMVISSNFFDRPTRAAPLLVMIMIGTTLSMALARRKFPDEERGLRNAIMTQIGFEPPDIPPPAAMRNRWSGAPVRALPQNTEFMQLGLHEIFPYFRIEPDEETPNFG